MSNLDSLQRLIYLCQIKNDLNRKRRRFYYYLRAGLERRRVGFENRPVKKHIDVAFATKGYRQAQKDMKAMTQEMRKMRIDCGVRFIWNDGGLIEAIQTGGGKRLSQKMFKKYYEAEIFEMELFGGK